MITENSFVKQKLPCHKSDAHKGNRGKVLIIGGSRGFTGAICLAANGALRSGAGLITVAVPESLNNIFEIKLTEVMTLPVPDDNGKLSSGAIETVLSFADTCDAVAFGPGAGICSGVQDVLHHLLDFYRKKLIIDADGLNVLQGRTDVLKKSVADILITPHVGEMSRLTGVVVQEIQLNRELTAVKFAQDHSVSVLLKGEQTIITNGVQTFVNPTGNNGMAKGGSGDVLAGVCVSLAAQGVTAFESGVLGAYIHGLAGNIAREKNTDFSMTPSDIIDNLGNAYKKIFNEECTG